MRRAFGALAFAAALGACGDDLSVARCPPLDPGACPASGGGSCDDPTCRAIYACVEGAWQLRASCSPANAGPDARDAAAADVDAGASCGDAGGSLPAAVCSPELELPDCPDSLVRACPASACTTGCESFFACGASGWEPDPVATCAPDGTLVLRDGG